MNIAATYDYLCRARRDLWAALADVPGEVLARPLVRGDRFRCIKDFLFHIAAVEDGWVNEDIRRVPPVWESIPALRDHQSGDDYSALALVELLDYWRAVERNTLAFIETLTDATLSGAVSLHDAPAERYTMDGLLWHVMIHEMRHTAQVCVLLRTQGITPPSLDLLFYLPQV